MPLIVLDNVTKVYSVGKPNEFTALRGVSLTIERGEFVSIMGVSGSGKSTLMHIIGCLDQPTAGTYMLEGEDVTKKTSRELVHIRRKKIGFVFQSYNLLAKMTTLVNVELPLVYNSVRKHERERRSLELLRQVGLGDRARYKPSELSGGEEQRVAIARALINNPTVVLADEPTGNLDTKNGQEIMNILESLNKRGVTIVVVTHDPNIAKRAHRTIQIQDGRITND